MRAVIYARYSSDNQREASIEDQVEVCRRYIERQGWTLSAVYDDRALSGASTHLRPGFLRLLADAETRRFDVVVCEAIDRLSRNLADVAGFFDRLTFRGVQLHGASLGAISQMHIGIMGTMAQMYVSDLRDKTRRGQLGRARAGRIPGGLAYGYDVVAPAPGAKEAGERRINEREAAVVRRIFRDYAAGIAPRRIARDLNAERVPGPGGRPWGDTTLRGQVDRGTGLLNNTLYVGQLSWNRCSYLKDPRTGKRIARVNPEASWEKVSVPELRIIDDEVWQQVRLRQTSLQFAIGRDTTGQALNRSHRRAFLLSGLLVCGCCGGGYTIVAQDRYGCATRRIQGTCDNARTITRQSVEARVLSGLKDRLLAPELVAEFVRSFAEEMATLQREAAGQQGRLQQDLADVERRLQGVLRAVENGAWNPTLHARLSELEANKTELLAGIAAADPIPAVCLHPASAEIYRSKVATLEASLNAPEIKQEAAEVLRSLIEQVVLTPDATAPNGLAAELFGDLAMILALAGSPAISGPASRAGTSRGHERPPGTSVLGGQLSVVAGIGFEPMTFRL